MNRPGCSLGTRKECSHVHQGDSCWVANGVAIESLVDRDLLREGHESWPERPGKTTVRFRAVCIARMGRSDGGKKGAKQNCLLRRGPPERRG